MGFDRASKVVMRKPKQRQRGWSYRITGSPDEDSSPKSRSKPSCNLAASDMRAGLHGGSKTISTLTSFTSGKRASLFSTSDFSTLPMPQPGAVIDILMSSLFPPGSAGAMLHP